MSASQDSFERKIIRDTIAELRQHPEINAIFQEYLDAQYSVDREYAYVLAGVKHTGQDTQGYEEPMTRMQMLDDVTNRPLEKPIMHCNPKGNKNDLKYDILVLAYGLKMEGMTLPDNATPETVELMHPNAKHIVWSWLDQLEVKWNIVDVSEGMKTPEEYQDTPSLEELFGKDTFNGISFNPN